MFYVKIENDITLWAGSAGDEASNTSTKTIRKETRRRLDLKPYLENPHEEEHEEGGTAREAEQN